MTISFQELTNAVGVCAAADGDCVFADSLDMDGYYAACLNYAQDPAVDYVSEPWTTNWMGHRLCWGCGIATDDLTQLEGKGFCDDCLKEKD